VPRGSPRVRSHCRFRNSGAGYVSESGMKRTSGGAKRQCDRALCSPSSPGEISLKIFSLPTCRGAWGIRQLLWTDLDTRHSKPSGGIRHLLTCSQHSFREFSTVFYDCKSLLSNVLQ
jgi:hypothetical protein